MQNVNTQTINNHANFIWSIADLLRGTFKAYEYADVILPLTVMRRLDHVLEKTHDAVLQKHAQFKDKLAESQLEPILKTASGQEFFNISPFTFTTLLGATKDLAQNLELYIQGFSPNVRELFTEHFGFMAQVQKLDSNDLLFVVLDKFKNVDLHPEKVSNLEMGYIFEELIRRFNEQSNETAGEHFTPREVIRLMVQLLFVSDQDALKKPGVIRTIYDPTAGTGGMLSIAKEHLLDLNPTARVYLYGQEINPKSYAVCKSDLLIMGEDDGNIKLGNTLTNDGLSSKRFDYMLSNPPYGVDWKGIQSQIEKESQQGFAGRFGAGTPRVSDGSLLFLQHLISKIKTDGEGSRIGIVLNGSPLFTGDAGSGESEIRRWILENDWLDALVALPDQLFYNTGINTYIWILDGNKPPERKNKVQLINATSFYQKMRKSLGNKRNEIGPDHIRQILELYQSFEASQHVKIFDTTDFGYRKVTIERPLRLNYQASAERLERLKDKKPLQKLTAQDMTLLHAALQNLGDTLYTDHNTFEPRLKLVLKKAGLAPKAPELKAILEALSERDENAEPVKDSKGNVVADPELRDTENVPLNEDVYAYFAREVQPFVPDAWVNEDVRDEKDRQVGKVGYEISFTRYFYEYKQPRPLEEIEAEIKSIEKDILNLLGNL